MFKDCMFTWNGLGGRLWSSESYKHKFHHITDSNNPGGSPGFLLSTVNAASILSGWLLTVIEQLCTHPVQNQMRDNSQDFWQCTPSNWDPVSPSWLHTLHVSVENKQNFAPQTGSLMKWLIPNKLFFPNEGAWDYYTDNTEN